LSAQYFHSVSATDNYVKCPCNNFIKRHFNQYFVNNNNNNTSWHPISYRFEIIADYSLNFGHFAFMSPPLGVSRQRTLFILGSLESSYSGLPISVNWLFLLDYGWGAMSENRFKIGFFAPIGSVWPKISGRSVPLHQLCFLSKLGWMVSCGITCARLSCGHKFLSFCHIAHVGQTDG